MAGAVPMLTAWPSAAFGCRWTVTLAGSWERSRVGSSGLQRPAGFVRGSRALVVGSGFCTSASWDRGLSLREEWRLMGQEAESCSCKKGSEGGNGNRLQLGPCSNNNTNLHVCGVPWGQGPCFTISMSPAPNTVADT